MIISQEKFFSLIEVIKPQLQNERGTLGNKNGKIHEHKNTSALGTLFLSLVFYSKHQPSKTLSDLSALSLYQQKKSQTSPPLPLTAR